MPEPTSTTTVGITLTAAFGITLASLLNGIDGNALIGAFAGAALFVISSREHGPWYRFAYLLISVIMGYKTAPEITSHTFLEQTAVAAFVAGLLCVTVSMMAIEAVKQKDLLAMLKGLKK